MQGFNVAEQGHVVNVLPPVDISGGASGDVFSMRNHGHVSIVVAVGVSAAAFTKIIVNECSNFAAANPVAIPYRLYAEETAAGDTLGAAEAVLATGRTPSANDNIMYVIEIDARELSDGKEFVQVQLTNTSPNSVVASVLAFLTGARHSAPESATEIA